MQNVLILGCGPAGLFAAKAVEDAGFNPIIVSRKRRSEMFGAQYLHRPVPGLTGDPFTVHYSLTGTPQVYRDKVYGVGYRGIVSPEEYEGEHEAWDIRDAYLQAWDRYASGIKNAEFSSSHQVAALLASAQKGAWATNIAHYISTIPAPMLCVDNQHGFASQSVWAVGDAPERGVFSPITSDLNTVVCSGDKENSWYRRSNILGYNSVEWPITSRVPIEGVAVVSKPLSTNCDCFPFVHRLGRYGKWTKGVLSDAAYYDVIEGLRDK